MRRLPVLNREKRLVGIIALADLGTTEAESAKEAVRGVSEPTGGSRTFEPKKAS